MVAFDSKFHSTPARRNFRVFPGNICQFFAKPAASTEGIGVQLWRVIIAMALIRVGTGSIPIAAQACERRPYKVFDGDFFVIFAVAALA